MGHSPAINHSDGRAVAANLGTRLAELPTTRLSINCTHPYGGV